MKEAVAGAEWELDKASAVITVASDGAQQKPAQELLSTPSGADLIKQKDPVVADSGRDLAEIELDLAYSGPGWADRGSESVLSEFVLAE